jgi:phosphoribosyl-AMP cyclohydrolase
MTTNRKSPPKADPPPAEKIENRKFAKLIRVLKFNDHGLIPAVIQDRRSKRVLTLCYLNDAALKKSLSTGTVYLFRRSQQRLMQKGETSGHIQRIREIAVDCEGKSLVVLVDQRVAACHVGYFSCYFRRLSPAGKLQVKGHKVFDPHRVYRKR